MKNVTIKNVAALAGVSISSVSRYIKDPKSVRPIAAVKIGQAVKELNYVPSLFAQNLRRGHNNTIGVLVPDLTPYFSAACVALNQFFYENKYLLIVCDTGYDATKERFYLRSLMQQRVAGLIVASSEKNEEVFSEYTHSFTRVVLFDRDIHHKRYDSVGENNMECAYDLTKHILDNGYTDLALLFNATEYKNNVRRYESANRAITEAGLSVDDMFIATDLTSFDKIYRAIREFAGRSGGKKAIISYNPIITEGATMAMNALNIKVGEEIELSGFTIEDYQSKYRYNIPRVIQSPYSLGMKAGEIMLSQLNKTDYTNCCPKEYILKNKIVY